jgi:glycosyltransferase involved in cell wall biosynthesis
LKVLLAHNRYQIPGGEEVVFEQEKQLLEDAGHETSTYTRSNDEIENFSAPQRLALIGSSTWSLDTVRQFSKLLTQKKPDIVHVHNTFFMLSPSIYAACKSHGVPVVQTLHNFRLMCPSSTFYRNGKVCEECTDRGLWRSVYHGCFRDSKLATASVALTLGIHRLLGTWDKSVTRYIALTEFGRKKFIEAGLPAEKIAVKPNFVRREPLPAPPTQRSGHALFVGRLSREKGVSVLLRAWAKAARDYALQIVGDGPERANLEAESRRLGLTNVQFRGRLSRDETIAAMRSARFLLVPSLWYETFGLCIAEAFACATPVICSRLGAMEELVSNGHTGLHFRAGDADDLAERIAWASSHPVEMRAMGDEGLAEYESKYTPERNRSKLIEIYDHARAEHRGSTFVERAREFSNA